MDEIELPGHRHPLYPTGGSFYCSGCSEIIPGHNDGYGCSGCFVFFHKECAESSPEINHPSHPRHPLTLLTRGPPDYADTTCRLCGAEFRLLAYHCSACNFSVDPVCARKPPPLAIDHPKSHEHTLTLMPRKINFTCNACGKVGDRSPYVCPQCDFMVHKDCIYLPRVINIIRHEHRISRTLFLGPGNWVCGVCRRKVDGNYGAYSCSVCSYAVHSRCATRSDEWDGRELEGEPEEIDETEDVEPFKVVGDKMINHFSHEHDLKLIDDSSESKRCQACILPIYFETFYSCMQCDFILHETCANLPRKKRHVLHTHPLTLHADGMPGEKFFHGVFNCSACKQLCSGFRYKCCNIQIDVRCGSISEPFIHKSHQHPLFLTSREHKECGACNRYANFVLNCIDCDFHLDSKCSTLPITVRHKYDDHPLVLRYGEEASGQYWCEICEKETDPKKWFYSCDDCGFTPHVECILGNYPYVKPGHVFEFMGYRFVMASNNRSPQPSCYVCYCPCEGTLVLESDEYIDTYVCSISCLWEFPES